MATRAERAATQAVRDDWDARATAAGHALVWQLGADANKRGCAYFLDGECSNCGAAISVGSTWTSSYGVRDARHVPCSGPGTAVLTDIENAQFATEVGAAVKEFMVAVEEISGDRPTD